MTTETHTLEDGQNKCEKCGSTEISLNIKTGKLRCHWCRHEQAPIKIEASPVDISNLKGQIISTGAQNIALDENQAVTLKCTSCAAEVIVNAAESIQARCHWCRHTLSLNQKVPNGAVPDKILPFSVNKDIAFSEVEKFVKKRKFFAHPKFKAEFTSNNLMGVYLPYKVIDANVKTKFRGQGEILLRKWDETRIVGSGKTRRTVTTTYYDADRYSVSREMNLTVEGLTIESNSEKLQHRSSTRTNNVVNAIKPFDLEKSMTWDANFMTGYTAQKRDLNVEDLRDLAEVKIKDIARHQLRDTIRNYNRGVRWEKEDLDVIGKQWKAAYFPVWLYSYQLPNKSIHYVAVNGQTAKTMGSVPIHRSKLILFSSLIGGLFLWLGIAMIGFEGLGSFIIHLIGFLFWYNLCHWIIENRYRNEDARFSHENSTKSTKSNIIFEDILIKRIRRTKNSTGISAANSDSVKYKGG